MMRHYSYSFIFMGILLGFALMGHSSVAGTEEPELPLGIDDKMEALEPELPDGLNLQMEGPPPKSDDPAFGLHSDLSGFWEVRAGIRTQNDAHEKDASLGETRLQLEIQKNARIFLFNIISDFIYDPVFDHHSIRLTEGQGFIDLREANVLLAPLEFMDIKLGRQILTWGTGDMLFLNDLFPKDWKSFFIGRDVEYLKAPSDALKVGVFTGIANLDVVYIPRFDPDRFIEGKRISYWNSSLGRRAGRNRKVKVIKPDDWFKDSELAIRLSRNVRGYELAAYGYYGFWKSPAGLDPLTSQAIFPDLSAYGASIRGKFFKGIGHLEFSYYLSRDDENGRNPFIKNSEFRNLIGYEQEAARDFTVGVQYYLEYMMDYHTYLHNLPQGSKKADEDRHVITLRLTKLLINQNLKLSFFAYYSPSDQDAYLRPLIHYKINDHWSAETGGNIFWGEEDYTFFGQFEKNSNLYAGLRYGF
ncbi:MAG: hypothetical protein J7M06_05485 [Proteobacteria bacterium]|nr:hypothetical protein [Pseudomonadota bacterium]